MLSRGLAFVEGLKCAATEQGTLQGHLMSYFFSLDDLRVNWWYDAPSPLST